MLIRANIYTTLDTQLTFKMSHKFIEFSSEAEDSLLAMMIN